jgi:hypothetical protein
MSVTIQTGNSVTVRSGNRVTISAPGPQGPPGSGGGGTPGGLNTQVQFNDAGAFGGDAGLSYNKTTDTLTGVNQTFTGLSTLNHIHGNIAGSLYVHIKNTSGVTIAKGTPVYATGSVGSSGEVEVAAADYTNSAKMPSIGITDAQLIANAEGNAVVVGEVMGLATNSYSINQELFVGTAGLLGALPTTGEAQSIAVVSRVHASTGIIVVNAQARLNAALRALANNVGSNLTGITAAQVGALAPDGDGSALTGITADQVGALAPSGDGSALTGITATQVGALEPNGDGSALTGITAAQLGAIADGDTLATGLIFPITNGVRILDTAGDHALGINLEGELTANRGLTFAVNDGNRSVNLSGNLTVSGDSTISGTNTGDVTLAGTPDYITISGQTITRNAIDLAADVTGTLPIANGGTGQTTAVAAFDALAPTTTKGDLIVHNGSDNVRVPVGGTNGHVLTVDSAEATGVKWAAGGGGGGGSVEVQVYTANDTWNKPANAQWVEVVVIAGGGGGGSGERKANGTTRFGGGGGGAGAIVFWRFAASELGSTATVTVGAGGTGGAAIATDNTGGANGTAGGDSVFGPVTAKGGGGGGGSNGSAGAAGAASAGNTCQLWPSTAPRAGISGGAGGANGGTGVMMLPGGGGGGGGMNTSDVRTTAGSGSESGGGSTPIGNRAQGGTGGSGSAGVNGGAGSNGKPWAGAGGGGGGGGDSTTLGGSGGNGGAYGGAGGGGGASPNGGTVGVNGGTGAGGNGGAGIVIVTTYID